MTLRREAALVATLAGVTTVALTYPLAFQLGDGGRVDSEDGLFSIWNIAWVARTVVADPTSLFDANIFYPHRNALAFSEANLVAGVLAAAPYWLTGNPYTAHNTVALLSFMLSLIGAYLLVRHLTGRRSAATVSGVLFSRVSCVCSLDMQESRTRPSSTTRKTWRSLSRCLSRTIPKSE